MLEVKKEQQNLFDNDVFDKQNRDRQNIFHM